MAKRMRKNEEIAEKIRAVVSEDAICFDDAYRAGVIFSAQVPMDKLRDVMSACAEAGYFLETITGLDFEDTAELVYHLNCYEPGSRIAVRVLCDQEGTAPTVIDIYPSASWLEREVHDFYGIRFSDNPDMRPLLLPEDADYHPLRKTFGKVHAYRKREDIYG